MIRDTCLSTRAFALYTWLGFRSRLLQTFSTVQLSTKSIWKTRKFRSETWPRAFSTQYLRCSLRQDCSQISAGEGPESNGDPRVLFDQHSRRWIVIVSNFGSRVYLAVSSSESAMGSWFKTNFTVAAGSDAGKWNDYPTLGVDQNGIYVAAYMVGGSNRMSIFAINKAPLVGQLQWRIRGPHCGSTRFQSLDRAVD